STRLIANANPSLPPNLLPSLQWVAIGLLVALFLWFRPQGLLPERKRVIALPSSAAQAGKPSLDAPSDTVLSTAGTVVALQPLAPPGADDIVLRAIDVGRDFGGVHAVAGVSLEVRRGTLTGLIGPNGAGKSTLLALLAGTDNVSAGQILYHGADVTRVP